MTDTRDTRSLESTIDKYLAAWTETDPANRTAMVSDVWANNGQLVDPPLAATGHDGISEMAATMQSQFPGHTFRRASAVDAHHDQFRFAWDLVGRDGTVAVRGVDFGDVSAEAGCSASPASSGISPRHEQQETT